MAERALKSANFFDRILPHTLPSRFLLIFFAFPVQMSAEVAGFFAISTGKTALVGLAFVIWALWFALVFMIARQETAAILQRVHKAVYASAIALVLILSILLIGEAVGAHLILSGAIEDHWGQTLASTLHYNDATALNHQASEQLIQGLNPYPNSNIVDAYEQFEVPTEFLTPLKQGSFADVFPYPTDEQIEEALANARTTPDIAPLEFESKLSYPAGSFLFQLPFIVLGMNDVRFFYLLCALALVLIMLWLAPGKFRPLIFFALATNIWLWNQIWNGTTDTLYVLFIFVGWILMRKNLLLSALFMGLAATAKQPAWIFILFYLVLVVRQLGWKQTLKASGLIGATFISINIPFIFGAPTAWLEGVLAPVLDPMFPSGDGLVAFSIAGILPPNSLIYMIMEISVLGAALVWYYFKCRKYPTTGLLLAVLPFFFAWRSYSSYFCLAVFLVLGVAIVTEYSRSMYFADSNEEFSPA